MAEREGFEPSIRTSRIPDFESGAFDHSAISPHSELAILSERTLFCFLTLRFSVDKSKMTLIALLNHLL